MCLKLLRLFSCNKLKHCVELRMLSGSTSWSSEAIADANMLSSRMLKYGEFDQNLNQFLLSPPATVRGMKVLDREAFSKTIYVPWLAVCGMRLGHVMKHLKRYLLRLEGFKPVQDLETLSGVISVIPKDANKRIVLNPLAVKHYEDISEGDRNELLIYDVTEDSFRYSELKLTYNNWKGDELLKAVLPEDKDSLTSYSLIGHIVHVNLREHLLDYKHLIGEVLLNKIKGARTIVNKTYSIDNTYRNFSMEILCGENDMMAQVKENHCTFEFDFALVFWNPRLCTEHERIIEKLKQGDILYDVFAGVGPFSVPAAKKKCIVLANDLNPESYKWLQHNGKLNKVQAYLQVFNKDGGLFIKEEMRNDLLRRWKNKDYIDSAVHITMNLPAIAVEFLENFIGLFTVEEINSLDIKHFPVIYLYCFAKGDNPVLIAKEMVERKLGFELKDDLIDISHVRNVSVKKEMMRVTFRLSKAIITATNKSSRKADSIDTQDGPQVKRLCIGQDVVGVVPNGETKEEQASKECV